VALHGKRDFLARHAAAVIGDRNQAPPTVAQYDVDARGAGVDGVLHQFLDGGSRALDDFARGDAVDERFGQDTDGQESRLPIQPLDSGRRK
jgi:hypothetical protein